MMVDGFLLPQKPRNSCQQQFLKTEETSVQGNRNFQPCYQRLREYRFYVNVGRGVNISCDRGFYTAFNNKLHCLQKQPPEVFSKERCS